MTNKVSSMAKKNKSNSMTPRMGMIRRKITREDIKRFPFVLAFIERARTGHPEVEGWSENTRRAVAQKYSASIRDFGLAKGTYNKTTVRPALYGAPVRLLVRALRSMGTGALDILNAPAFRLLGLEGTEVIDAFGELNRVGALRFRMQGDVVELDIEEGR